MAAVLHSDDRVRDAERKVVVGVHAELGGGIEHLAERVEALGVSRIVSAPPESTT